MFEQFLKPASVDEAVKFKSQFKDDSVFIAGGSKLMRRPRAPPRVWRFPWPVWG